MDTAADVCSPASYKETPEASAPRLYAVATTYALLIEAMDQRRIELGLSHDEWNERAGLATGFTSKALGPSQTAKWGLADTRDGMPGSLFRALHALGLNLVLEINATAEQEIRADRSPRMENHVRPRNLAAPCGRRTLERALHHLATEFSWNDALAAVAEARRKVAAEQEARAAREAARAKRTVPPPPPAPAAAAAPIARPAQTVREAA